MRALIASIACGSLILTSAGCSHVVHRPFDREVTEHMDVEKPWIELEGWTDAGGETHQWKGYAQVAGDSVLLYDREPSRGGPAPALSMSRSEITHVHVRKFSALKTSMVVAIPIAVLLGCFAAGGAYSVGD